MSGFGVYRALILLVEIYILFLIKMFNNANGLWESRERQR
jgi:hypothetical protein